MFKDDFGWQGKFAREIKEILGRSLIATSPPEEDKKHNTDFMTFVLNPVRVACRIRRHSYWTTRSYRNEFTIRSGRPSGYETELDKLLSGWGDYIFYGFSNRLETNLCDWFLGDLNIFRERWSSNSSIGFQKSNIDQSSDFRVFNRNEFPEDFIVASSQIELIKEIFSPLSY